MADEGQQKSSFGNTLLQVITDFMGGFASQDPNFGIKRAQLMQDMEDNKRQRKLMDMKLKLMEAETEEKMKKIDFNDLFPGETVGTPPEVAGGVEGISPDVNYGVPSTEPQTKPGEFNLKNLFKGGVTVDQATKYKAIADIFKAEKPKMKILEREEGPYRVSEEGPEGKIKGVPGKSEKKELTNEIKNYQFDMKQRKDSGLGEISFKEWEEEKEEVKRLAAKEKTPPSAGNAVDLAIKRKFGTEHLTDPKKVAEGDKWLNTPDGRKAVQQARDDLTPPAISVIQTGEGIKTIETRGEQRGKIKETGELPPMSEDLKKDYTATAQAYDLVNELKTQWDSFEHGSGSTGRAEAVKTYVEATAGKHPNAKVYVSNREAFLGNLSRSLAAERGVLTQQDIERIAKALPKIGLNALSNDNKEEANKKWDTIYTIINNAENRLKQRAEMRRGEMKPIVKEKREGKKVVGAGTEKGTGKRVIKYDDGSIEYAK